VFDRVVPAQRVNGEIPPHVFPFKDVVIQITFEINNKMINKRETLFRKMIKSEMC
jgi:hypothetical protein